jgi:hypothetical protein
VQDKIIMDVGFNEGLRIVCCRGLENPRNDK